MNYVGSNGLSLSHRGMISFGEARMGQIGTVDART